MRGSKKSGKKTAFVPKVIFRAAAVITVVPLCACGGKAEVGPTDGSSEQVFTGVGEQCFAPACTPPEAGGPDVFFTVAAQCFDSGCEPPETSTPDVFLGVAAECFDGGVPPCPHGVADAAFKDVILAVAVDAFGLDAGSGKG